MRELDALLRERCGALARRWQRALAGTSYVPLSSREVLTRLRELAESFIVLLVAEPFHPEAARDLGMALVRMHFTQPESLGQSLDILGTHLLAELPVALQHILASRLTSSLAELATGFTAGMRATILDEQESIRGAVVVAQRQAEEALRESEARFHAVFAEAAIGIGIGDMSGRILEANRALQEMFGYPLDEFRRLNVSDFVHPDDAASVWESYAALINGNRDYFRLEKRFFRRNSDVMWTRLTVSLVRDAAGAPTFQIAMLEDITEARRAQADLEAARDAANAASRAKSDFLANMSHELRTPLHAIIGFTELLQDGVVTDDEERSQCFDDIHASAAHLLALINDVLDLSKIEAGRMELEYEAVDLPELFATMMTLLRDRAQNRQIRLTADAGNATAITADARKVQQILFNLLANGIKFTEPGGEVSLTAHAADGVVVLTVTDTGIGIADEDQQKLFRPFTQVDASLTRRHEGTGLGLALTQQLVALHGGQIAVRSTLGAGSTFTVILPKDRPNLSGHPAIEGGVAVPLAKP
jgi:PAS domain S-box-containing protein